MILALREQSPYPMEAVGIMGARMEAAAGRPLLRLSDVTPAAIQGQWGKGFDAAHLEHLLRSRLNRWNFQFAVLVGTNAIHEHLAKLFAMCQIPFFYYLPNTLLDSIHSFRRENPGSPMTVLGAFPWMAADFPLAQMGIVYHDVGHPLKDWSKKTSLSFAALGLRAETRKVALIPYGEANGGVDRLRRIAAHLVKLLPDLEILESIPSSAIEPVEQLGNKHHDVKPGNALAADKNWHYFNGMPLEVMASADVVLCNWSYLPSLYCVLNGTPVFVNPPMGHRQDCGLSFLRAADGTPLVEILAEHDKPETMARQIATFLENPRQKNHKREAMEWFAERVKADNGRLAAHTVMTSLSHRPTVS